MRNHRSLVYLLLAVAALSLLIAFRIKLTEPMPGYLVQTAEWAANGHIVQTFTPDAYPLFLGGAYRLGGNAGILAIQAVLQVGIAALCYLFLRELGLPKSWSAWGSLPVILYPDLLISIAKVWDIGLSVFLVLAVVICGLRLSKGVGTVWLALGSGLVLALAVFSRPNLILLLPLLLLLIVRGRRSLAAGALGLRVTGFLLTFCGSYMLLALLSHGSFFLPGNGPYNLYAGNNPYTASVLIAKLNAEPSIAVAIAPSHPNLSEDDLHSLELSSFYTHAAVDFMRQHPATEGKLVAVKFFTLLRPDTKLHGLTSPAGMLKGVMALPILVLLVLLLLPGRPPLTPEDYFLLVFYLIYILPFLITNSDPRFRVPLDALFLLHAASLLGRRLGIRADAPKPLPAAA